ncbi:MAG: lectin-like domain-containing protein [Cytophagales bacterium]
MTTTTITTESLTTTTSTRTETGVSTCLEAGFSDPDGDGILCTSPVIVNNIGQVIGCASLACNSIDDEDYNLVGDAEKWTDDGDNEVYRLTPEQGTTQSGSVWSKEKINLSEDFKVEGKLNLGSNASWGADGIAFVIQPLASDLGGEGGGGLGYAGISPSVAVEFDTWNNGNLWYSS